MADLNRLSDLRRLARLRAPTRRLPFLDGDVALSPFQEGRSYLLSAYSKVGKTEVMIRVVQQWGEEEWGARQVLWVSEESQSIWEDRALKLPDFPDNILIAHAMGIKLEQLGELIEEVEHQVLVIDTVKMLQIKDENDVGEVMAKLTPLLAKQQREGNIAILLHHTRKQGGSHGMSASGSHAFSAATDAVLEIQRGKPDNRRKLLGGGG